VSWEFVAQVINGYGIPAAVLTDQGANFHSEIFKYAWKLLKIKKIQIPAFYPESNSGLERCHRVLRENDTFHYGGSEELGPLYPYATFVYNITEHVSTGNSPFELVFGYKPRLPSGFVVPTQLSAQL
jgi:hypothetical protein